MHHGERLPAALRRMAVRQSDIALYELAAASGEDARRAVHETRKAIKRLRTIVRLLGGELGPGGGARERDALRAAAGGLSAARDAGVMLATLEALLGRKKQKKLARSGGVARLKRHLAREREHAERRMLEEANRLRVADELRAFRDRALHWELVEQPGIASVEQGLALLYRQGRKRFRRAVGRGGARTKTMHQWRKRVKDLRYAAEALQRSPPDAGILGAAARSVRPSADGPKWLRGLAEKADELGEVLGEEHDLAVLGDWLSEHGARAGAGRRTRRRLRKLIRKRRARLRRRALRAGSKLYSRKTSAFLARVERAYQRTGD
jgi:CHAD domain-containing protein